MRVAQIGILKPGVIYSDEYKAVLDRATALGYTHPSTPQKKKQNQLILDLKAAGIWTLLDTFNVFATNGSSDFATLNWKSPTSNQCTKINSPTFTTNIGFNGNGTTSYVNSNYTPSGVNYSLNSCGYGGYIHTESAVTTSLDFGVISSSRFSQLNSRRGDNTSIIAVNTLNNTVASNASSKGFWHLHRTSSSASAAYKNGLLVNSNTIASNGPLHAAPFFIGARSVDGTSADSFSARAIGMFWAGNTLAGKEVDFYNAWNTYFTSL